MKERLSIYMLQNLLNFVKFFSIFLTFTSYTLTSNLQVYAQSDIPFNLFTPSKSSISTLSSDIQQNLFKYTDPHNYVPNQYMVILKEKFKDTSLLNQNLKIFLDKLQSMHKIKILTSFNNVLNGFVIKTTDKSVILKLQNDPRVAYVEQDQKVHAFFQTLPTGVNRIDADLSRAKSGDGLGKINIDVAVIDSGIDLKHPDLNVVKQKNFIYSFISANDDNGHGTHVAGIIGAKDNTQGVVGVVPGANLWALKVLDRNGNGVMSNIIKAIDYVTANRAIIDIVNLSIGCKCSSTSLNSAITKSVDAGIIYVVAAGNSGTDARLYSPANHPKVITVSAISDNDGKCGGLASSTDDKLAYFSNYGNVIDISAPGVAIYSTYKGGTYATLSGTSFATPHVSGAMALYKSLHPFATSIEIQNAILSSGTTPSTICDNKGHGYFSGDKDSYPEPLTYVKNY